MNDMQWHRVVEQVEVNQAYKDSCLGWVLHSLVLDHKPETVIEIGTFCGFTAIYIAAALAKSTQGQLNCFDLWEKYPHKHTSLKIAEDNILAAGLQDTVLIHSIDARAVPNYLRTPILWKPFEVDFVYIDISNTGDTYRWAADEFYDLLSPGGLLVLEGGTEARDQVEWMVTYDKVPILLAIEEINWQGKYGVSIYENFPGLTVLQKI